MLLPARELVHPARFIARQVDQIEHLDHPPLDGRSIHAAHAQAKGHVLKDVLVRKEREVLKHQPKAALMHRRLSQIAAMETHLAGVDLLQPGHDTQ